MLNCPSGMTLNWQIALYKLLKFLRFGKQILKRLSCTKKYIEFMDEYCQLGTWNCKMRKIRQFNQNIFYCIARSWMKIVLKKWKLCSLSGNLADNRFSRSSLKNQNYILLFFVNLIKFRLYNVASTVIEKMYPQIPISQEDYLVTAKF